ncbi:uncharacterized protein LOC111324472 [Stylophora pistillata]|uniref:uncharacterized protein LOC111324472 n=1 Tax=Stylophora pistillata TaxID=50429 RepID=UPI000C03AA72|nr:uncharacterized protein LOC111324472 [Stylophora pistillata]
MCFWRDNLQLYSVHISKTKVRQPIEEQKKGVRLTVKRLNRTRPHVVYNLLKRSKLDANREINEATLNVPDAITAYNDYANFISQAKLAISGSGSGRGFLLDIHGQTHQPPRTELGYLISKSKLVQKSYNVVGTSIRNLGEYWCGSNNACFQDFVQGNRSLGYFVNQEGLAAVPSPLDEDPNGEKFFSGGYTTRVHGSKDGGNIDAIQLELPRELRFEWNRNVALQNALANAIVKFYQLNYDA